MSYLSFELFELRTKLNISTETADNLFGLERGWCWSCWKMKRISELEKELSEYKARV